MPKDRRQEFNEVYEKARLKGVAYVRVRSSESEDEVHEAIESKYRAMKKQEKINKDEIDYKSCDTF